ncbi:MAG: TRIC cation channel family protein [Clostridia bacterium]|nr:TRIC cation channel family protein [Clostridia bacterium]
MYICFLIFEIIGVIAFAFSGALTAKNNNMDIFGACMLGMITTIGGGIMRDMLLGVFPPSAPQAPWMAILSIILSAFYFILPLKKFHSSRLIKLGNVFIAVADSVGLAVFTIIGVDTALGVLPQANMFTLIFAGAITGIGGGIIRDVVSGNKPLVFVTDFYACASILGAAVYILFLLFSNIIIASVVEIIFVLLIRFLAIKFHWNLLSHKDTVANGNND